MTTGTLDDRIARLGPTGVPDPARLTAAQSAVYTQILASSGDTGDVESARRVSPAIRWGSAAAAVAALTAGLILWSPLTHSPAAFASWVAVPSPVTPGDAEAQHAACTAPGVAPAMMARHADELVPVVAERRGDYTFTLMVTDRPGTHDDLVYSCLLGMNGHFEGGGSGGGAGIASANRASWSGASGGTKWRSVWGPVGSDVSAVTITRLDGVDITATVSHGYFAAWWPRPEVAGDGAESFTYTWYLSDGSVGGTDHWTGP